MEPVNGRRVPFSILATTTPKLLVDAGSRQCVVVYNASGSDVRLGASGSLSSLGVLVPSNMQFHDLFTNDDWWVLTTSGSGTVSGYVVV